MLTFSVRPVTGASLESGQTSGKGKATLDEAGRIALARRCTKLSFTHDYSEAERACRSALDNPPLTDYIPAPKAGLQGVPWKPYLTELLGDSFKKQGKDGAAIAEYLEVIRLNGGTDLGDEHLRREVAMLLSFTGHVDDAIAQDLLALREISTVRGQLAPDDPGLDLDYSKASVLSDLADLYIRKGNLDRAITYEREALQLEPDDPNVHVQLARSLKWKGDEVSALGEYRIALDLVGDNPQLDRTTG